MVFNRLMYADRRICAERKETAQEFQKLLDHPALVGIWVTGSVARLQLARAEVMSGDRESARKHYQDFFAPTRI